MFSSQPDMKSSISRVICLRYKKWIQGKSGKFDNSFMMHFDFKLRQSNQSIKKVIIYFLKPMVLSNLKLRFTTVGPPPSQESTWPYWGWPHCRTEKTRSDLEGKTNLTGFAKRGNRPLWCLQHLVGPWRTNHQERLLLVVCLQVVSQGFGEVMANLGPRLNLRWCDDFLILPPCMKWKYTKWPKI